MRQLLIFAVATFSAYALSLTRELPAAHELWPTPPANATQLELDDELILAPTGAAHGSTPRRLFGELVSFPLSDGLFGALVSPPLLGCCLERWAAVGHSLSSAACCPFGAGLTSPPCCC
jgi:hypothetical protein